ncbi:hypothetical protein [Actinotalea sp. C106]|uniref:hypothetical protein n=1 Tax=Actinotalea sp. C106 TaxID=2908644 RepID=UPI00202821F4|nr:hypothetical protein [Actinotalea sp. C106]
MSPGAEVPAEASTGPEPEQRWVALIRGDDRPGTLTALSSVFSTRGVSFTSLATGGVDGDVGSIAVTFCATTRRARLLARTVERLSVVRSVVARPVEDPQVRAAGVVRMPDGVPFSPAAAADLEWSGDASAGRPVLVEGPFAQVGTVVEQARREGAVMTAVMVLGIDGVDH